MPSTPLSLKRRSEVVVNRSEKVAIVEEMNASFAGSSHVILTTFTPKMGLSKVALSFWPADARPGSDDVVRTDMG